MTQLAEDDLAGWAAVYAAAGLPVLPVHWIAGGSRCSCRDPQCRSQGKHPLTRNGKDDATTDAGQLAEWWGRWPLANVGIRPPAGTIVLDVDPRNQGGNNLAELVRLHGALPQTLTACTGGGGLHIWLAYSGRHGAKLCTGVDIKSHSGYVVAPPSPHVSGSRYAWGNQLPVTYAPGWLQRLLDPPREATRAFAGSGRNTGASADGLVRVVAGAAEGNRNPALYWAARRACERGGDPQLLHDLASAALSTGLTEREVRNTISSAARAAGGAVA